MLKALTAAIESVEANPEAFCQDGLCFQLSIDGWTVRVSFDGFADLHNEKTGQRRTGKIPKDLMRRVARLLRGTPPPRHVYDEEPF